MELWRMAQNFRKSHVFCFGIDNIYVWPALVSIYSAKKHYKKFHTVVILFNPDDLDEKLILQMKKICNLLEICPKFLPQNIIKNAVPGHHITRTAYLRMSLPNLFKGEKIFWFDADLLFLENWHQILNYTRHTKQSMNSIHARKHWGNVESATNQAIISSNGNYFNSGVLIFNSKIWKKNRITAQISEIMKNYTTLGFEWADQCVLNYCFHGKYDQINSSYNSIPSEFNIAHTRIIHFAGTHKPWTKKFSDNGFIEELSEIDNWTVVSESDRLAFELYRTIEKELHNKITRHF